MRLIIATDEDGEEELVNYVDASTFARIYVLVMENKSLIRSAELRNEAVDAGQKSPTCNPNNHVWKEEYYGYKCERCPMFIPYGCEPWLPVDE